MKKMKLAEKELENCYTTRMPLSPDGEDNKQNDGTVVGIRKRRKRKTAFNEIWAPRCALKETPDDEWNRVENIHNNNNTRPKRKASQRAARRIYRANNNNRKKEDDIEDNEGISEDDHSRQYHHEIKGAHKIILDHVMRVVVSQDDNENFSNFPTVRKNARLHSALDILLHAAKIVSHRDFLQQQ